MREWSEGVLMKVFTEKNYEANQNWKRKKQNKKTAPMYRQQVKMNAP